MCYEFIHGRTMRRSPHFGSEFTTCPASRTYETFLACTASIIFHYICARLTSTRRMHTHAYHSILALALSSLRQPSSYLYVQHTARTFQPISSPARNKPAHAPIPAPSPDHISFRHDCEHNLPHAKFFSAGLKLHTRLNPVPLHPREPHALPRLPCTHKQQYRLPPRAAGQAHRALHPAPQAPHRRDMLSSRIRYRLLRDPAKHVRA